MNASEFIKKTWIELIGEEEFNKIEITEDGWLEVSLSDFQFKYNRSINGDWHGKGYNPLRKGTPEIPDKLFVRPKKLNNWENNNGWIKIESHQDLPKETGHYWVKRGNDIGINYIIAPESLNSGFLAVLTHYKPIEKSKPPMY